MATRAKATRAKKAISSTRYGQSPWVDAVAAARVPAYPKHRGASRADVVVIGAGLTGCTTAYALAAAGVKVVVVEAAQIGRGASGGSTGWIADDPCLSFPDVEKAIGRKPARHVWRSWHRAALDFGALLRRLNLKCDLAPHGALLLASTPDQLVRLRREQKTRHDGGVDAALLNPRAVTAEVALPAVAAIRNRDGFTMDPYRASLGLAAEAVKRGALFFEHSAVRRITFGRKAADVFTASGAIHTDRVVVATGLPTPLFKALARHFWFRSAFLALTEPVPVKTRKTLGTRGTVVRDMADPPHAFRWVDDERLLISGADRESPADRLRDQTIVQRTGQLMYELSTMYPDISGIQPSHGWESAYARTADGLPYIGAHRNYPHHLFAFGDCSPSVTSAYLAARVVVRNVEGKPDPADEALGFNRYGHVR